MKYKDFPKYTGWGNYKCDVPLQYVLKNIQEYIEDSQLDMNPDFQRGHVWNKEKQIAYVEHLFKGGRTGCDILFNHPGWMRGFQGDMVLVDGKQRLEAIRAWWENEIPIFGVYKKDMDDTDSMMGLNIVLHFHINDLKTRKEVLQWYLDLNSGGVVHTQEEIDKVKKLLENEK